MIFHGINFLTHITWTIKSHLKRHSPFNIAKQNATFFYFFYVSICIRFHFWLMNVNFLHPARLIFLNMQNMCTQIFGFWMGLFWHEHDNHFLKETHLQIDKDIYVFENSSCIVHLSYIFILRLMIICSIILDFL